MSVPLDITIRTATSEDYSAIVAISKTTLWEKSHFLKVMISRGAVDVASVGGRIAGFNAWNREFFSHPMVWLVVVNPDDRRKGVASRLFAKAERESTGTRLYSSTNRSNVAMQRFHEKRGYRVCGEVDLDPGDPEVFYCIDL